MLANWVHPDEVLVLGVAHTDVAGDTLGVAVAGPVAEDGGHVHQDVLAVFLVRLEGRDT